MQDLSNITTLDLVIVALYLLGMLGIGVYFVRRIQNAGDYYVAGRSLASGFGGNGMCNDYRRKRDDGKSGTRI